MNGDHPPEQYDELFHEPANAHATGQQPPSLGRAASIAVALVLGLGLVVTAIVVFGGENGSQGGDPAYACGGEEATIIGTDGDDELEGTNGRDVIHARRGDDIVTALGGNDLVCGGAGNDKLDGGRGRDIIIGGDGEDECSGGDGASDTFEKCESTSQ